MYGMGTAGLKSIAGVRSQCGLGHTSKGVSIDGRPVFCCIRTAVGWTDATGRWTKSKIPGVLGTYLGRYLVDYLPTTM